LKKILVKKGQIYDTIIACRR